jgi:hypothetical protein
VAAPVVVIPQEHEHAQALTLERLGGPQPGGVGSLVAAEAYQGPAYQGPAAQGL